MFRQTGGGAQPTVGDILGRYLDTSAPYRTVLYRTYRTVPYACLRHTYMCLTHTYQTTAAAARRVIWDFLFIYTTPSF